jgi:RNA-directed DNA polymerase
MKCPACHHNNPNDAVFCMKCGKKLQKECIHCGAELPENALFCIKCGKKLTSSGLLVVMCSSPEFAQSALDEIRGWVSENGLTLHPDKTHIGDCMVPGKGFDFLGYRFEAGKRWVRKKSMKALRGRIRNKTRRTCGNSLQQIIEDLNPMLIGWFGYFKHASPYTFKSVDGFIRRRLRAILRKQQKRPGMGQCRADNKRWPNAFFATQGLFTMTEAHALARQSRC